MLALRQVTRNGTALLVIAAEQEKYLSLKSVTLPISVKSDRKGFSSNIQQQIEMKSAKGVRWSSLPR
jgi:hypothetical protein